MDLAQLENELLAALNLEDTSDVFPSYENNTPPGSSANIEDCAVYFLKSCLAALSSLRSDNHARAIEQIDLAIIHVGIVISSFRPRYRQLAQQVIDYGAQHLSLQKVSLQQLVQNRHTRTKGLDKPVDILDWQGKDLFSIFQLHVIGASPTPVVLKGLAQTWPASTNWTDTAYLLKTMANGYRHVPVESGLQYTDSSWSMSTMPFYEFLQRTIDGRNHRAGRQQHYLAQYNLFDQVPELKSDIQVPSICYVTAPSSSFAGYVYKPVPDELAPITNIWFGPAGTVSPLHRDEHHNVYVQVVGYKYFRLYKPTANNMYADPEMPNTSRVDLSKDLMDIEKEFPEFGYKDNVVETVLGPGDALYIPFGWWHYVESLSISIGVNFWF